MQEKDETSKAVDVFLEAAMQTINTKTITLEDKTITTQNVNLPTTKKTRKTWKDLKEAIDNEHAERFNKVLNELPDREFVRVYLKSLEFFKPKIIRQEGGKGQIKDNTINIQINYGNRG